MIEPDHDRFRAGVEPALAFALADELDDLTEQLNALAFDLGSDADTLRRHMSSLQAIDRIVQTQLAIAGILRIGKPAALAGIGIESVSNSLRLRFERHRETA